MAMRWMDLVQMSEHQLGELDVAEVNLARPSIRDVVRFRVPLDEEGGAELDWQRPAQASACGTLFLAGKPTVTCLLLPGYDALRDEPSALVAEDLVSGWCEALRMRPGPGLRSVRDRPLLVCIPWLGVPLDDRQRRRFVVWAVCLAAAFFRRACECARRK